MLEAEETSIAIGKKRGEDRGIIQTARNLVALGLSTDIIAKGTGLSEDLIESLRSEHSKF